MAIHAPALTQDAPPPPRRRPLRALLFRYQARLLVALAMAAVVAVAVVRHWHAAQAEERAVSTMPATDRNALYEQLLRSTEMLCARARADDALLDRCADSASFIVTFPECDRACRGLAYTYHRGATR